MLPRYRSHPIEDGVLVVDQWTGAVRLTQTDGTERWIRWPDGTLADPPHDPEDPEALAEPERWRVLSRARVVPAPPLRPEVLQELGEPEPEPEPEPEQSDAHLPVELRARKHLRRRTRAQKAAGWALHRDRAALLALAVLALVLVAPLLFLRDALFVNRFTGDMIATIWFYDLVGQSLPDLPTTLDAFDWPNPMPVAAEFPATADAVLGGLLMRWQGWQAGWGFVQASALLVNAAGVTALAYAAGARGPGLFVAGALALTCRQTWFDLASGRLNAAWPGFSLLSLACLVHTSAPSFRPLRRVGIGVLAVLFGSLAAQIYPPHLLGFAPLALFFLVRPVTRRPSAALWVAAPVLVALLLNLDHLNTLLAVRSEQPCSDVGCADETHALDLYQLARGWPAEVGLLVPGLFFPSWAGLLLVPLHRRRGALLLGVATLLPLLVLSLGPCPRMNGVGLEGLRTLETLGDLWCALDAITDYGRAATVAALGAAVLTGVAWTAIARRSHQWWGAGAIIGTALLLLLPETLDSSKWVVPSPSPVASFLRTAGEGVAVELPYALDDQLRSALEAPGRQRLNPLKPALLAPDSDDAIQWLHELGQGRPQATPSPSRADLVDAGLRWVIVEPGRCGRDGTHCAADWERRLKGALGEPVFAANGAILVWDLGAASP